MTDAKTIERAVTRLQRALDEAYARYAGAPESDRLSGMTVALREALGSEPEATQALLVEILAERHQPGSRPLATDGSAIELAALRLEVERLQVERDAAPPAEMASTALLSALLGAAAARESGAQPMDATRVVASVQALAQFAADLAKAFLGPTDKADARHPPDRLRAALVAELTGTQPVGSFAAVLNEIKGGMGAQIEAFAIACQDGARQLLKVLDPLALEYEAPKRKVLGYEVNHFGESWKVFQRRYEELATAEDLYATYFDGPLRRALYRLGRKDHA